MRLVRPPHIDADHPIATQEYAVYTPPISELIDTISNWMDHMESGGYIFGPSRFGKSRGVKWFVRTALEERFQHAVPLVIWIRRPDMHVSESGFWKDLLLASNFHFVNSATRSRVRDLFRHRLIAMARAARSNYVVLVIDEAQDMTLREWQWLLGLQNVLDYDGFRLSVFSIGTQQIGYQHDYLAKSGNAHIAARFFVLNSQFHGLRDSDELQFVLEGYDRESEWPQGSGKSYLNYFAPDHFRANHRLSHCTSDLWRALEELLSSDAKLTFKRQSMKTEIPMKHVALSVEEALWRLADGKDWEEVTCFQSWMEIVSGTGFTGHMRAITNKV